MRLLLYYFLSSSYWNSAAFTHTICSQPFWFSVLQSKWHSDVLFSVPRQVHCLFRSELSTECDLVFRRSVYRRVYLHSWIPLPLKMEPICCHETSVTNYQTTLRKMPEEHRSKPEITQVMLRWLSSYCAFHYNYVKHKVSLNTAYFIL